MPLLDAAWNIASFALIHTVLGFLTAGAAEASTAYIAQQQGNSTTLLQALLQTNVSQIVLLTNYTIGAEFEGLAAPIFVNRNVTVTSLAGTSSWDVSAWQVLNMQFHVGKIHLCRGCVFTFTRLVVANVRQGIGAAYDVFVGDKGSIVVAVNAVRLRMACIPVMSAEALSGTVSRSTLLPNSSAEQLLQTTNVEFHGHVYESAYVGMDFTQDIPYTTQADLNPSGGYAVAAYNVTVICLNTVSDQCLQRESPDACVSNLIDDMLRASEAAPQPNRTTAALAATIATPLGAAALLALGVALVWARRRRQQQDAQENHRKPHSLPSAAPTTCDSEHLDLEQGISEDIVNHPTPRDESPPHGKETGWEVTCSLTAPLMQHAAGSSIQLGELIVAGSVKRVYKALWAGKRVAVKVMQHDTSATPAVMHQAQLLLKLSHPNLVQAYHCVSYAQAVVSRDGNVSLGRHSSSGSSSSSSSLSNDGTSACETQRLSSDSAFTPPAVAVVAAVEPDRGQGAVKDAISRVQPSTIQSCLAAPAVANYSAIDIGSVQGGGSGGGMGSEGSDRTDGAHSADQTTTAAATAASTSRSSRDSMDSLTCSTRNYSIALQHAAPVGCTNAAAGAAAVAAADADIAASGHTTPDQQQATLLGELLLAGPARAESWLVMEYCDLGTLHSVASGLHAEQGQPLPGQLLTVESKLKLLLLLRDVASGLKALHDQQTVHGDLRPHNVLVSSSAQDSSFAMVAKIADKGLSRVIKRLQDKVHRTPHTVGSVRHIAPEVLRGGQLCAAADIYSFGITCYEVLTGQQAFRHMHYKQFLKHVVRQGTRPAVSTTLPGDVLMLMERCWAADPAERPTASRLLELLSFLIQVRQQKLATL